MFYTLIIAIGLLCGGGWILYGKIEENAVLKRDLADMENAKIEAENNVLFQQGVATIAQERSQSADRRRRKSEADANLWKGEYAKLFKDKNSEASRWGDRRIPSAVAFSMCNADGKTDAVCAKEMASAPDSGVSSTDTAEQIRAADEGTARGDRGLASRVERLQRPAGGR